jgi:predicted dehydrogenase
VQIDRVLIVGLGSIGTRHLRLARALLPNANIRVLRHQAGDIVPELADGMFSSLNDAIAFAPQIAVIANPATHHLAMAQPLAEAGVHLLVEKPLSNTLDKARDFLDCCRAGKTIALTGYNLRFLPSLQRYRDLISEGLIGTILSVRCEIGQYLPSWRPGMDYQQSVSAQRKLGGGALLELSHEIDYVRWIFGEVSWVMARLSKQSDLRIDVEDSAHLILGFASDGVHQLIATLNLDFIRHDTTRICTAIGAQGSLRWNGLTGVIEHYISGAKEWQVIFSHQHQRDDSYLSEWQHFLSCVKDGALPSVTAEDGIKVLQIVDAAHRSSESESKVHISMNQTFIKAIE